MIAVRKSGIPKADVLLTREGRFYRPFNATADTDSARGTALLAAQAAATSDGDCLTMGPGTFNISTNTMDLSRAGAGFINLRGAGLAASEISSAATGGGSTVGAAILHPGSGSEIADLAVLANLTNGDYQGPIGSNNASGGQSAFTGAIVRNCRFTGQSDSFYINNTGACSGKFYDCEFISTFDAILLSNATGHMFQFWNCYWNVTGPNISASQPGRCRAIRVQQGTVQVFGGEIICLNGGDNDNKAVNTIGSNATIELYGGVRISSTNTGAATAYDLFNQLGTIKVAAGVVYDSSKVSGTITYMKVYGVTPSSGGLTTLSS